MPMHDIPHGALRERSRTILENLELWLRRLIHDRLRSVYGANYIDAKDNNGDCVIRAEIRKALKCRRDNTPNRYVRPIDAATLNNIIDIICKPQLYNTCFKEPLKGTFPDGHAEARTFLKRLIDPRNSLSHANAISVRQAEQVVCYSNDIIDALKKYYLELGMDKDYNAPTIITVADSFGYVAHDDELHKGHGHTGPGGVNRSSDVNAILRPGDRIFIEATIDPSFDPRTYRVWWDYLTTTNIPGNRVVIDIKNEHVMPVFQVTCHVASDRGWHRLGHAGDDYVTVIYKVLPPLS